MSDTPVTTEAPTSAPEPPPRKALWLQVLGPGLLVAATGVGAGDIATAAFTGSQVGLAVAWAVVLGALLKWALTEGLARYQIATGRTVIEGSVRHFGWPVFALFVPYFLIWSYVVGGALVSACGVATHALVPVFTNPADGKQVWGTTCSLLALGLVLLGGYRLVEKLMSAFIALMFVTVVITAFMVPADWLALLKGLVWPAIPDADGKGVGWTIALMGGVGGTLTILSYGYWLREEGRALGPQQAQADYESQVARNRPKPKQVRQRLEVDLIICRIDLGVAYAMTAVFGVAMLVIGSTVEVEGKGASLIVMLADRLEASAGSAARIAFLVGAWGAIFSSLLGVLQAVPYMAADLTGLLARRWKQRGSAETAGLADEPLTVSTRSRAYRGYLVALALVPLTSLYVSFVVIQQVYAIIGALFMPMLAIGLLVLNGRSDWLGGKAFTNRPWGIALLALTLGLFGWIAVTTFAG